MYNNKSNYFLKLLFSIKKKQIENNKYLQEKLEELENIKKKNKEQEDLINQLKIENLNLKQKETEQDNKENEQYLQNINLNNLIEQLILKNKTLQEQIDSLKFSFLNSKEKSKKSILFISSSELAYKKVVKTLNNSDYQITFVNNVKEAIELCEIISFDYFFADLENISKDIDFLIKQT